MVYGNNDVEFYLNIRIYMKSYYLYPANDGKHKYYIIAKSGRKILFGAVGYSDFTKHKDEDRKQRYINRHENNENWGKSGIDTAGWLLWNKPTTKDSYNDIKSRF
jgi:hypothetical protein